MRFRVRCESDLHIFARYVSLCFGPGDALALIGELGVGKTTFVRKLLQAYLDHSNHPELAKRNSQNIVSSPTFGLVNEYDIGSMRIVHADLYRLEGRDIEAEIGLSDYADDKTLLVVEWADLWPPLCRQAIRINLNFDVVSQQCRVIDLCVDSSEVTSMNRRHMLATDSDVYAIAAMVLEAGGIVGYPTESSYGLAVDPFNEDALIRLNQIKGRANNSPYSVIVPNTEVLDTYVTYVPPQAKSLIDRHWPGPLTLVLPARPVLPRAICGRTSKGPTIAIRYSSDPVAIAMSRVFSRSVERRRLENSQNDRLACGITATSANLSGSPPATSAETVASLPGVDFTIDDGPRNGAPSTIISVNRDNHVNVLRSGPIDVNRV